MRLSSLVLLRILFFNMLVAQRCNRRKNLDDMDPCNYKNVLMSSFGPCNSILPGIEYAKERPKVFWPDAREELDYLLIMVDADNPTPEDPLHRYYIIWMVFGVVGECFHDGIIEGTIRHDYEFPSTAFGMHRYQIYIYEQGKQDIVFLYEYRTQFNFTRFAKKFNVCLKAAYQIYGTVDFTPTVTLWVTPTTKKPTTQLLCGVQSFVLSRNILHNVFLVVFVSLSMIHKITM